MASTLALRRGSADSREAVEQSGGTLDCTAGTAAYGKTPQLDAGAPFEFRHAIIQSPGVRILRVRWLRERLSAGASSKTA